MGYNHHENRFPNSYNNNKRYPPNHIPEHHDPYLQESSKGYMNNKPNFHDYYDNEYYQPDYNNLL